MEHYSTITGLVLALFDAEQTSCWVVIGEKKSLSPPITTFTTVEIFFHNSSSLKNISIGNTKLGTPVIVVIGGEGRVFHPYHQADYRRSVSSTRVFRSVSRQKCLSRSAEQYLTVSWPFSRLGIDYSGGTNRVVIVVIASLKKGCIQENKL